MTLVIASVAVAKMAPRRSSLATANCWLRRLRVRCGWIAYQVEPLAVFRDPLRVGLRKRAAIRQDAILDNGWIGHALHQRCVFKEIADIVVTLINAGADVGDRLIPDISVGRAWAEHWTASNLAAQFGERAHYEHSYPDYFPQAKSNPQTAYCYPDAAYGEFKRFMRTDYLPTKMPGYLKGKVKDGVLSASVPEVAMKALASRGTAKIVTSAKPDK